MNGSNVQSTGGLGNFFENSVQTAFAITMLLHGRIPSLPEGDFLSMRLQAKANTDDFVASLKSKEGHEYKFFAQIKHHLTFTATNEVFKEVIGSFWSDYNNDKLFNKSNDKLAIIVGGLSDKHRNHTKTILDWASAKSTVKEFLEELDSSENKKNAFNLFKEVLNKVQTIEKTVDDERVWRFLQSIELLEYDFSSSGSIDKSNFLTLIKVSKNENTYASENDIWGSIFNNISQKNSQGATILYESFCSEFNYFKPNFRPLTSLSKLINDSKLLFDRIKNTIGETHVTRRGIFSNVYDVLNSNQIVILTGDAGAGKSAFAKDLLATLKDTYIISFVADQFIKPKLSDVLQVPDEINEILSRFALFPNKIVYVDSLEKILEGEADAFRELLAVVKKYPQLKLVMSCRDYALQSIDFEYLHDFTSKSEIQIPDFSEGEMSFIKLQLPELKPLLQNEKLSTLLRRPKYLAFGQKLVNRTRADYSEIDQVAFLKTLWDKIVKNDSLIARNIHERRHFAFIQVCVKRAKEMTLFTDGEGIDDEALLALTVDDLLIKNDGFYSPAHDILEDWALINYISTFKSTHLNSDEFFSALGNEPAIRRGFRLWLENEILKSDKDIYRFISKIVLDKNTESHWRDETIVAILNSDLYDKLLTENETVLLKNDGEILKRFIHLLRVACNDIKNRPRGNGWPLTIKFIFKNLSQLKESFPLILGFLLDWESKIYIIRSKLPEESKETALILFQVLGSLKEDYNSYANGDHKTEQVESGLKLLLKLTEVIQEEVKSLLNEVIIFTDDNKQECEFRDYYDKVIEFCLSGLYSGSVPRYFPKLLVSLANSQWKQVQSANDRYRSATEIEQFFGLSSDSKRDYMPPSARQTFIYSLLLEHPVEAIDFIVDFINYATGNYLKSKFSAEDNCVELDIIFDGKTITKQWGSTYIWSWPRPKGKTVPYVVQSVLKGLEKYFIDCASSGSFVAHGNLRFLIDRLMEKCNSVATTSVIASVTMAFPDILSEKLLYFVNNIEFFQWDATRWLMERPSTDIFPPISVEELIFNRENKAADELEHRKKYQKGLHGFVVDYQFETKLLNDRIHRAFDVLHQTSGSKDIYWRKVLNEIDLRKWKQKEYTVETGRVVVHQVEYEEDVLSMVNTFTENQQDNNRFAEYSAWIREVYEGKESKKDAAVFWIECWQFYLLHDNEANEIPNAVYRAPGLLAIVGLRKYYHELSEEQIHWCIATIVDLSNELIDRDPYSFNSTISIFDKEPVLSFLPKLLNFKELNEKDLENLKGLLFYAILKLHDKNDRRFLSQSIQELWETDSKYTESFFYGLIKYAEFYKKYDIANPVLKEKNKKQIEKIESSIIASVSKSGADKIDFDAISYKSFCHFYLERALEILPLKNDLDLIRSFLQSIFKCHLVGISSMERRSHTDYYELGRYLQKAISFFLINTNIDKNAPLLELILNCGYDSKNTRERGEFIHELVDDIFYTLDRNLGNDSNTLISNFWQIWERLFDKIAEHKTSRFSSQFLLAGRYWKETAEHWIPLETGHSFFEKKIPLLEKFNVNDLISLLTGLGFKTLSPSGIIWVMNKIRENPADAANLNFRLSEKFAEKNFRSNAREIKHKKKLLEDYISFLNILVDLGSSKAYLIRENMLLYKANRNMLACR